jgi:choline dehydrogenase-like flavoprotein
MKRPNLQVATNALVRHILFDGKRAIGGRIRARLSIPA